MDALRDEKVDTGITSTILWLCILLGLVGFGQGFSFTVFPLESVLLMASVYFAAAARGRFMTRLRNLMEIPSEIPQLPTMVEYWDGDFVYGQDFGVAILTDGMVHFQGRHSHFSIPQQTRKESRWTNPSAAYPGRFTCLIDRRGTKRQVSLRLLHSIPNPQRSIWSHFRTLKFGQ